MKRIRAIFLLLAAGVVFVSGVHSQSQTVVIEAARLREATAPRPFGDVILFTYKFPVSASPGQVHTVQAAFEHQMYSELHPYQLNAHGVYVLLVERDQAVTTLRYRLVVDGVWTVDPFAPASTSDRWGVRISEFVIPSYSRGTVRYPHVSVVPDSPRAGLIEGARPQQVVEFRFRAESGKTVTLVGSFNGWDPFMTPMTEVEPGLYSRRVRLASGEHLYYFFIDGLRIPDPGNASRRLSANGSVLSVVELP
jgi:hypothetical protein